MLSFKSIKLFVFSAFSVILRIIGISLIVASIVMLLAVGLRSFQDAKKFKRLQVYLEKEYIIESLATTQVKEHLPVTVQGKDLSLVLIIVALFIVSRVFNGLGESFNARARKLSDTKKKSIVDDILDKSDKSSDDGISIENIHDREKLRKIIMEAKKKLSASERQLAFLSIDVANSTAMKVGEEKITIEHDFAEYKKLVETELVDQGALKSAWTPDGVMICFSNVNAAVATAKRVLVLLENFNKNIKYMKSAFTVRCGINAGSVNFDESSPLEEVSDHVIDVAGHMQKYAKPGEIFIAKEVLEALADKSGFSPAGREVDGYDAYSWKVAG